MIDLSDIHKQLFTLRSLQRKTNVRLWKLISVDYMIFESTSVLMPEELRLEWNGAMNTTPSSAYAVFLNFLCHYHLKNVVKYREALEVLQLVTTSNYLIGELSEKAAAYNILGIGFKLLDDMESAQTAFLISSEIYKKSQIKQKPNCYMS